MTRQTAIAMIVSSIILSAALVVATQITLEPLPEETVTCIRWVDITGETGWTSEEDFTEVSWITSCGILVKEDDDALYLAMDKADGEGEIYNSTGAFPKGVIRARQDVVIAFE